MTNYSIDKLNSKFILLSILLPLFINIVSSDAKFNIYKTNTIFTKYITL